MFNARHLIAALALAPLVAVAAMSDSEATRAVQDALASGQSADSVIQMLRDDGRSVSEATNLAVAAAEEEANQSSLAKAGICAAQSGTEATRIATDLLPQLSGEMVGVVQGIVANFDSGACDGDDESIRPPSTYAPSATSNSGGGTPDFPGSPSS